jgi:TorA maturation chaperone TorD
MADIAGFYRAFGLDLSPHNTDRVDFLSTELEFLSFLSMKEAYAWKHQEDELAEICRDAQRKFLAAHLGRWIGVFVNILSQSTTNPFYVNAGFLAERAVECEARRYTIEIQKFTSPSQTFSNDPVPFQCTHCVENIPLPPNDARETNITLPQE